MFESTNQVVDIGPTSTVKCLMFPTEFRDENL
jgi:hypothetical protein